MKKIIFLLFISCLFGCKPQRFLLEDSGNDSLYLSDSIHKIFKAGKISKKPIILIDGTLFNYNENIQTVKLDLKRKDIQYISYLDIKAAQQLYGTKYGKKGVVIIETKTK
jgi:hypothetical protein